MNLVKHGLVLSVLFLAGTGFAEMEVHEWGTFTSLVGSNGITQPGMYHEDEALPDFVHDFGQTRSSPYLPERCPQGKGCVPQPFLEMNNITQKMETPVIYFYTDRPQSVEVNVMFPDGVITETYPAPIATFPTALDVPVLANGNTTFKVKVLTVKDGHIPYVEPENIYGHARNVASNLVVSGNEQEKFIFYRGLGRFQPRISITSASGNLSLNALSASDKPLAAFLVHVDPSGHGKMINLGAFSERVVSANQIAELSNHNEPATASRTDLVNALSDAGLFNDEALAMVNTWENGYLKVPGLRLLYILPSKEVDAILPLTITPAPEKLTRAFVARIEILLDTEETRILNEIQTQGSNFAISTLGRFAEPILRRVSEKYEGSDTSIKNLFTDLIAQSARVN